MGSVKIRGIVTSVVRHSDRHNVLTLYTRERGRVALLVPAGKGKSAAVRNASLMPLSVISCDISFRADRELQFLGQFQREYLWKEIYFEPVKSAVAIFIAEFVNVFTRNSPPDPALWDYIVKSVALLDTSKYTIANFHLGFLVKFLYFAGVKPDLSDWQKDDWFDMLEGICTPEPRVYKMAVPPHLTELLPLFGRMNPRNSHCFRMNAQQRNEFLSLLLKYFAIHFPGLDSLKSPQVLKEIFS